MINQKVFTPKIILMFCLFSISQNTFASQKGVLSEINSKGNTNSEITETSELMISNAEIKAISALEKIIAKNKGTEEEPSLLFRLSELYTRRAKTARFFEFYSSENKIKNISASSKEFLTKSVRINNDILNRFPHFKDTDSVLFNNAFIYHQLEKTQISLQLYLDIIQKYQNSPLKPDALLAASDIYFQTKNFQKSLDLLNEFKNFKNHKVFTYANYKRAWVLYNLKRTQEGIETLVNVAESLKDKSEGFDLRKEALRDLVLFTSEVYNKNEIIPFFEKIASEIEYKDIIKDINSLYRSHSRFNELFSINSMFIDKHPYNSAVISIHIANAEIEDDKKEYLKSLENLKVSFEKCEQGSMWRAKNELEQIQISCNIELKNKASSLTKKWWEKWNKMSQNNELGDVVENAMRLLVHLENDQKLEEALTDILVQKGKFEEAAKRYRTQFLLSKEKNEQINLYYSYLSCLDKKSPRNDEELITAYNEYLQTFKESPHHPEIIYNLGLMYFQKKNYVDSKKQLEKIVNLENNKQIFVQDMLIEIFNQNKEYSKTLGLIDSVSKKGIDKNRESKLAFMKLQLEAQIAKDNENIIDYLKSIEKIVNQTDDKALKISFTKEIIQWYLQLSLIDEAAIQIGKLENIQKNASIDYKNLIPKIDYLNGKAKNVYDNKIEPFYSKIEIKRIENLFDQKDYKKVFDLSKKLISFSEINDIRAKARYFQARVLEEEQRSQSVKTNSDKLNLVFSLKMEKFDKTQSAYVSALQMAETSEMKNMIQVGLRRSITEFTNTIDNFPAPKDMDQNAFASLKSELGGIKNTILTQYKDILSEKEKNEEKTINEFPEIFKLSINAFSSYTTPKHDKIIEEINAKRTRQIGIYHLAKEAQSQNLTEKSLFIIEQLLNTTPENLHFQLEKEVLSSQIQNKPLNEINFEKFISIENSSTEYKILKAQYFYKKMDFQSVIKELSSFSVKDLYNLKIGVVLTRSLKLNNESEKAKKLIKELLSLDPNNESFISEQNSQTHIGFSQ